MYCFGDPTKVYNSSSAAANAPGSSGGRATHKESTGSRLICLALAGWQQQRFSQQLNDIYSFSCYVTTERRRLTLLFFETAFLHEKTMNKSRATQLLISQWKNSEENKKNLQSFSHRPIRSNYFLRCFSTDKSEANDVIL
jgi:hypothetical protein